MDVECPVCGRTFSMDSGECPFCGNPMTLACFNDLQDTADAVKEAPTLEELRFGGASSEPEPEPVPSPPVEEGDGRRRFRLFGR